jgi:4-amino-4-deoxy-L-arabinose transferase-like glycosyltransferase
VFKLLIGLWLIPALDSRPEIASYGAIANSLLAGQGYVAEAGGEPIFYRPPVYTFFLATLYFLFGSAPLTVTLAHIGLDLVTCLIIYALARTTFDRPVAWLAAWGVGFYPLALYYDTRQLTEPLFTLLLAGLLYFWVKANETLAKRAFLWAGLFWGLGALCRGSLIYFVVLVGGATLLRHGRKAWVPVMIFFISGMLAIAPWTMRNYLASAGSFVLISTEGPYSIWVGSFLATAGLDDDGLRGEKLALFEDTRTQIAGGNQWLAPENRAKFTRAAIDNISASPLEFIALSLRKILRFWFFIQNPDRQIFMTVVALIQIGYLLAGGVGLYYSWPKHVLAMGPGLLAIGYFVLLHALTVAEVRYSVPVMPYVIIFGSYACLKGLAVWGISGNHLSSLEGGQA